MAVDALEWAEDDEANPAGALEEILESPEKLKDLDLDAFAEELERQVSIETVIFFFEFTNIIDVRDLATRVSLCTISELSSIIATKI